MKRFYINIKNKISFSFNISKMASTVYYKCKFFLFVFLSLILKHFRIRSKFKIRVNKLNFFVNMLTSDIPIFDKMFLQEEYNIKFTNDPKIILDLGSNVGFSTLYFKSLFPGATIYAFEPNPRILKNLSLNCSQFNDIKFFPYAISDTDRDGEFFIDTKSSLGSSSIRRSDNNIKISVSFRKLDSVIDELGITSIDLLKFDIEGSEYLAFKNSKKISTINNFIGEIHLDLGNFLLEDFVSIFKDDFNTEVRKISDSRYIFKATRK